MPNRYRIARRLELSASVEVYEAFVVGERGFERRVLLQPLRWAASADQGFIDRFTEEARRANRLHHGNILALLDFGLMDEVPFQVLEFVDGIGLDNFVAHLNRRAGAVPPEVALTVVTEVAHGLAYAHEATQESGTALGIVHRGVGPATIVVSWAGEVKLSDFGIAAAAARQEKTTLAPSVSNLAYLAPEQTFGDQVGPPTDLFALGCVLHWLMVGRSPMDDPAIRERTLAGNDPALSPILPPDVLRIVRQATRSQPDARFPTASAMADACGAALAKRLRRDPRTHLADFLRNEGPSRAAPESLMVPEVDVVLDERVPAALRRFASVPPGPTPKDPDLPPPGPTSDPGVGPAWHDAPEPVTTARSELPDVPDGVLASITGDHLDEEPVTALVEPGAELARALLNDTDGDAGPLVEPVIESARAIGTTVTRADDATRITPSQPKRPTPLPSFVKTPGVEDPPPPPPPVLSVPPPEHDDPLVGTVLHGYKIEQPLGYGALARVYTARHLVLDHQYAVKVLYGQAADNERAQQRLRREAQTLSRLRHPNIVSVVDFGTTTKGYPFLTMELIEGQTLRHIIRNEAPLEGNVVAQIAYQIASALEFAHQLGVVHRDVKPANVMVDPAGTVKVLDFGIARIREQEGTRLTATDALLGTPRYMAPEQIMGAADVGPAADLYGLGALMYAMLAKDPPFVGSTIEVVERVLTERPRPLATRTGLEPLVMQLLEKQPEIRPSSGSEVMAAIDALQLLPQAAEQPLPTRTAMRPGNESASPPPDSMMPVPASVLPSSVLPISSEVPPRWPLFLAMAGLVTVGSAVVTAIILSSSGPEAPLAVQPIEVGPPPRVRAVEVGRPEARMQTSAESTGTPVDDRPPTLVGLPIPDPAPDAAPRRADGVDRAAPDRAAPDRAPPPPAAKSPRRTSNNARRQVTANRIKAARRRLRQRGLTAADIKEDPQLNEAWEVLKRAAQRRESTAFVAAEKQLNRATQNALTADRVKRRLEAFADRLRRTADQLGDERVAALEDRYLDLRARAGPDNDPGANAQLLRQLLSLESELRRAAPR